MRFEIFVLLISTSFLFSMFIAFCNLNVERVCKMVVGFFLVSFGIFELYFFVNFVMWLRLDLLFGCKWLMDFKNFFVVKGGAFIFVKSYGNRGSYIFMFMFIILCLMLLGKLISFMIFLWFYVDLLFLYLFFNCMLFVMDMKRCDFIFFRVFVIVFFCFFFILVL